MFGMRTSSMRQQTDATMDHVLEENWVEAI